MEVYDTFREIIECFGKKICLDSLFAKLVPLFFSKVHKVCFEAF